MPGNDGANSAVPAINADLKTVHTELIGLALKLDTAVGKAATAAEVNAVLDELTEVNARVTIIGRQLFTKQTVAITKAAQHVLDAIDETKKAIKKLDDIKGFIKTVTKFLGLVDKLLGVAKLVI